MSYGVTIDPVSQRKFQALIDETGREMGREAGLVIRDGATAFCKSARKATPLAGKRAEIRPSMQAPGVLWEIVRWGKQGQYTILTADPQDERANIIMRGLACNSWSWLLKKINGTAPTYSIPGDPSKKAVRAEDKHRNKTRPYIRLLNELDYIGILVQQHGIEATAFAKARRSIEHRLSRHARKMASKWW
jgi:hypothetical protein